MTNNGTALASWSTNSGTSTLNVREAVTHLPVAKPQTVTAQIHDPNSDVIEILADGLRANADGSIGLCYRLGGAEKNSCLDDHYV